MGSSKFRKAIGAVKDQTTIGLAKVGSSASISDLEIAIVKATRHEEYPAEERHIREVISLTSYSRSFITVSIDTISRRLNKTRNWTVAMKTLILTQRLLVDGDAAYEQEIFFATRRGTRILNMSDFRDSRSELWDYSAFVRTYALYLDERLEYRMQRRRGTKSRFEFVEEHENDDVIKALGDGGGRSIYVKATPPVKEMTTEALFSKMQHLQQLLDRNLSCKPSGAAKHHRVVLVALYPVVKDSFHIYYEMSDILRVLIERFMDLPVEDSVRVYEVFCRAATQLDELESFHVWAKSLGLARSSEYPDIGLISSKKLDLMDDFIRDKSALVAQQPHPGPLEPNSDHDDHHQIKALPPPSPEEEGPRITANQEPDPDPPHPDDHQLTTHDNHHELQITEGDLLNLGEDATTPRTHENQLALALFDGELAASGGPSLALPPPVWEAFNAGAADWESALVESASSLNHPQIRPALPGGFDILLLDGMYHQSANIAAMNAPGFGTSGSASSVAIGSAGRPAMLALPAPPTSTAGGGAGQGDPFAASLAVAAPPYVQMSDLEYKRRLLLEEQMMWEQYNRNGRQGHAGVSQGYGGGAGGYTRGY